jgi:hypothetical protein
VTASSLRASSPPTSVRIGFWLWAVAIATAIIEFAVRFLVDPRGVVEAVSNSGAELSIRCTAYVLLAILATLMLCGSNVARHLLALIFGCLGTFSLVAEPLYWIADGGNVAAFLANADGPLCIMILSRSVHVVSVLSGVFFGYRRDANAYFRRASLAPVS